MAEIVLTDQQASGLSLSSAPVVVRSPQGNVLGYLASSQSVLGKEAELILRALKARESNAPCFTTQEVLDHLLALDSK